MDSIILIGDVLQKLKEIPDKYVNTCVTSPPYWGLRDYGTDGQIGLESTPEEYVNKMVQVFREVKRVLRDDGTLWLNLGDSYSGGGRGGNRPEYRAPHSHNIHSYIIPEGLKQKDLVGIPWMVAFALRADEWYLRQDIIWHKPNPMPESVKDRCTKAHEYIFLLSKSQKYYYDYEAIKEPTENLKGNANTFRGGSYCNGNIDNSELGKREVSGNSKPHKTAITPGQTPHTKALKRMNGEKDPEYIYRNKRSVWTVSTKPFPGSHFATFPPDLIEPCILAGSPRDGIVLDPFFGAGTTGIVSLKNGRNYIGIELNPEYAEMAENRIKYGTVDPEEIETEKKQIELSL